MMDHSPIFWQGLLIGLFIGANVGIVFYSLCAIAKRTCSSPEGN